MKIRLILHLTVLSFPLVLGCAAPVGVSGGVSIPRDARNNCAEQCSQIGMQLSAVAIMANHIGCVCQPADGAHASQGAAPAGMATIAMLEQQEQERRQQQQRSSQQPARR
jgi:hypothetical protein